LYKIILLPAAEKFYRKLFKSDRLQFQRLHLALERLKSSPRVGKPLTDKLKGKYSLRVGVYRMIYSIEEKLITVYILDIGHRKEIYR